MNYPPANLWTMVQMEEKPESEPELVDVTSNLRVPSDWDKIRVKEFLTRWELDKSRLNKV